MLRCRYSAGVPGRTADNRGTVVRRKDQKDFRTDPGTEEAEELHDNEKEELAHAFSLSETEELSDSETKRDTDADGFPEDKPVSESYCESNGDGATFADSKTDEFSVTFTKERQEEGFTEPFADGDADNHADSLARRDADPITHGDCGRESIADRKPQSFTVTGREKGPSSGRDDRA